MRVIRFCIAWTIVGHARNTKAYKKSAYGDTLGCCETHDRREREREREGESE